MPFTPLHMGPGILLKALLQSSFSLMVFGWTQIIMDLQPLWVMVQGHGHIHGFTHTFLGACLIAVFSCLTGKYLSEIGLRVIGVSKAINPIRISWNIAMVSSCVGSVSHVVFDAMMHADVEPFFPIFMDNPLSGVLSVSSLHKLCLYSGLVGSGVFYAVQWRLKRNKMIYDKHND